MVACPNLKEVSFHNIVLHLIYEWFFKQILFNIEKNSSLDEEQILLFQYSEYCSVVV